MPAGTGDDFARGLRGKRAPLGSWIDTYIAHCRNDKAPASLAVDVLYGRSDGFHTPFICLNASTMGIGGETASRVAAQGSFLRRFSGEFRFLLAALGALAVWRDGARPQALELGGPGERRGEHGAPLGWRGDSQPPGLEREEQGEEENDCSRNWA